MAREVRIVVWCDRCLERGDHTEAAGRTGMNSNGATVMVDLCDECYHEVTAPFVALLDAYGTTQKQTRKRKPSEPVPCPECGRVFKTGQGTVMHRVRAHGYTSPGA